MKSRSFCLQNFWARSTPKESGPRSLCLQPEASRSGSAQRSPYRSSRSFSLGFWKLSDLPSNSFDEQTQQLYGAWTSSNQTHSWRTADPTNLPCGEEANTYTTTYTEHLLIDNGCYRQAFHHVVEGVPKLGIVSASRLIIEIVFDIISINTLLIETMDAIHLRCFVAISQHKEIFGMLDLVRQAETYILIDNDANIVRKEREIILQLCD